MSTLAVRLSALRFHRNGQTFSYDLALPAGHWVAVVGKSGSGKTTLLELIAGFMEPAAGTVEMSGADVTTLPVHARPVSLVFQGDALFAQQTIANNLLLALHDVAVSREEKRARVAAMLTSVGLGERFAARYPQSLSGGELARANVARALLRERKILLMDEPFAALDQDLRQQLLTDTFQLHKVRQCTTVCVTHHLDDALAVADTIVCVDQGRIVRVGAKVEVLREEPFRSYRERLRGLLQPF